MEMPAKVMSAIEISGIAMSVMEMLAMKLSMTQAYESAVWDWYVLLIGRDKGHPQADEGGVTVPIQLQDIVFLAIVRGQPLWHAASEKVLTCLRGGGAVRKETCGATASARAREVVFLCPISCWGGTVTLGGFHPPLSPGSL